MKRSRWASRKFWLAVSAQVTGVFVLLWPEHESVIVEASRAVTSLVVIVLASVGYVQAEARIDAEAAR